MRITTLTAAAALLLGTAAPALAQDGGAPPPPPPPGGPMRGGMAQVLEQRFAEMDADHDGAVSRAEFDAYRGRMRAERGMRGADAPPPLPPDQAGAPRGYASGDAPPPPPGGPAGRRGMGAQWFDRADADHDGKVTLAEAQAAMRAMMAERRAMRGGPGGAGDMPPPPPAPR